MKTSLQGIAAKIYNFLSQGKNFFYDFGFADQISLSIPVISVGNLTVGGTGKTPVIDLLIKETLLRGLSVGVVSLNYKSRSSLTQKVNVDDQRGAGYFGDEAFLLAKRNPEAAVYTGPVKWQTALKLQSEVHPRIIFVDDGFQHRALKRNFDIVLLDATAPLTDYRPLPKGSARESLLSLKRANLVIISKVNWANEDQVFRLKELIPPGIEVVELDFNMKLSQEILAESKILTVSGIARPESFRNGISKLGTFNLADHITYPDHHDFSETDVNTIIDRAKKSSCTTILTTEKDLVKLNKFFKLFEICGIQIVGVELKLTWRQPSRGLNEYLDQIASI